MIKCVEARWLIPFPFLFYEVRNCSFSKKKKRKRTGIARYLDKVLLITAFSSKESPITWLPHDHHRLPLHLSEEYERQIYRAIIPYFTSLSFHVQQVSRSRVNPSTRLRSKTNPFHRGKGKKEIFLHFYLLLSPHANLSTRNKHSLRKRVWKIGGGTREPGIRAWERRL